MKRSMTPRKCQIFSMQISPVDVQPAASVVNSSAANGSHRASAPMSYLGDTHSETTNRRFIIFICPSSSIHHQRSNIIIIFFLRIRHSIFIPQPSSTTSFGGRRDWHPIFQSDTTLNVISLQFFFFFFVFFLYASVPAPDDIIEPIVGR